MEDRLPACVARGRPSELFPEWLLAQRPAELSAWYRETYEKQAKRDEDLAKKEADAARHPGREWRAGRAQEPGGFAAPPRDPAAHAQRQRKRSMRFGVPMEVHPGEQWAHPGDTGAMWPGAAASHRAKPVPPKLTGGEDLPARDYCWVPLARRVDLDRAVNTLLVFPPIFQNVATTGEGSSGYEPWSHMNPYHISCQIQLPGAAGLPSFSKTPARVKIGVTDYWLPNVQGEMSSSGAKLYVQAKPKWSIPAMRMVCSVLKEADI